MARAVASILLLLLLSLATLSILGSQRQTTAEPNAVPSAPTQASINYVVIIMMENHPLNTSACCGGANGIIGNSAAPFANQLARNYSLAGNYFAVASGSLPDYLSMTGGSTFPNNSCVSNDNPPSASCSIPGTNIVDRIEASGRTWKAYMEDYSGGCFGTNLGAYDYFHNPFPYFADVQNNTQRCNRIVSANPGHTGLPDSQLLADLNSTTGAPNYMWLTPNEYNNMHGYSSQQGSISTGDNYLAQLVPAILRSPVFMTDEAALFITWDEPTTCTVGTDLSCPVPAIWVGPTVKPNYTSMTYHDHYSVLATLEAIWNLASLHLNDANATSMLEFFNPAGTTYSVANGGDVGVVAGGIAYDSITVSFGSKGSQSSLSLTMSCAGLPVNGSCSFNPATYSCNLTCNTTLRISTSASVPTGSYTITVAASSGAFSNSTRLVLSILKPSQLLGDSNADCFVDISDLVGVARYFGMRVSPGVDPRSDINLDGTINVVDLAIVGVNFGNKC